MISIDFCEAFEDSSKDLCALRNDIYRFLCTFGRALKICFALLRMAYVSVHFCALFRIALKVVVHL